jgi:hypothetical protein
MKKLVIDETPKTPGVIFDPEKGSIYLKGRSIPENSVVFYQPVLEAMDEYIAKPHAETNLYVQLDYFSTSSSKCLLDLFKKLENIYKKGNKVTINWLYEDKDENIRDAGADYETMIDVPFKITAIHE